MSYSPYAPPRNDPGPYGGGHYAQYPYQALGWKTTVTMVGIAATVALAAAQTGASLAFPDVLKHPVPENLGIILALGLLSLVAGGIGILTWIFFLVWMHQAAKNVRAFGQTGLEYTPGWCVGWWFIPLMSLWKPFDAMREIWKASDPESVGPGAQREWRASPVPATMGLWWGVYILNGVVGIVIALSHLDLSGGKATVAVGPENFVSHGLYAIAGVLIIMVMRQLAQRQSAAAERLTSGGAQAGPPAGPGAYEQPNPYAPQASGANPYT